eukprot:6175591-Pleurochrysis_carterae.AAC.2
MHRFVWTAAYPTLNTSYLDPPPLLTQLPLLLVPSHKGTCLTSTPDALADDPRPSCGMLLKLPSEPALLASLLCWRPAPSRTQTAFN